eukprot:TRINITY_DN122609_c0_g1_i1.p1 TRINITY_DN122609_c0_g1~~TRINITY_DN122609_c0_g1_i1.p1  ORF type:complete len:310 (-),score=131.40 TRINITY_DN122609_c0_g1_i1:283-1212(-)
MGVCESRDTVDLKKEGFEPPTESLYIVDTKEAAALTSISTNINAEETPTKTEEPAAAPTPAAGQEAPSSGDAAVAATEASAAEKAAAEQQPALERSVSGDKAADVHPAIAAEMSAGSESGNPAAGEEALLAQEFTTESTEDKANQSKLHAREKAMATARAKAKAKAEEKAKAAAAQKKKTDISKQRSSASDVKKDAVENDRRKAELEAKKEAKKVKEAEEEANKKKGIEEARKKAAEQAMQKKKEDDDFAKAMAAEDTGRQSHGPGDATSRASSRARRNSALSGNVAATQGASRQPMSFARKSRSSRKH